MMRVGADTIMHMSNVHCPTMQACALGLATTRVCHKGICTDATSGKWIRASALRRR